MTFLVGELATEIRLEGQQQYHRDLDAVGKATGRAFDLMKSGGEVAARALTAAGVAATALGVSLFKTGAAYNTLQQTSRAALRTLLGGAEAANAQMDKLDEFARTSPFSKAVFISAQQQLIGFGMAAERVVPTLDAIQNAVAAVGGSNEDIADITRILATVQSSGKITAVTLQQLGIRGVDAASIIGEAMGKTAQEVRDSITAGSLDAETALQALTDGMMTRFGGAAANVKETWVGATDRIKAATREIGAALAEPFISQQGGGMAVTWGNQVADVLQGVRGHAQPVVSILVDRLMPAFATWTDWLSRANVQVRSWDSSRLERFLDNASGYGPALAAAAGGVLAWNSQLLNTIPVLGKFIPAVSPVAGILLGIAAASPEVRAAATDVVEALQPLIPLGLDLAQVLASGLNIVLPVAADALRLVANVAGPLVDMLKDIPAPVLASVAAFLAVRGAVGPLAPLLQSTLDTFRRVGQEMAVQQALAAMEGNTSRFAGAMGRASIAAQGLGQNLKAAFMSNPVGMILLGVTTAAALLTAAFTAQAERAKEVKDKIDAYRGALDETSGAITNLTRAEVERQLEGTKVMELASLSYIDVREELIRAVLGEAGAYDRLVAKYDEAAAKNETVAKAKDLFLQYVDQEIGMLDEAAQKNRDHADAYRDAERAMSDAARSNQRFNEALRIARDAGAEATDRLKALKLALDELNGGTRTQAELERDLNEQTDRMRDVFNATDEAGTRLADTLVSSTGAIDTQTEAGRRLFDEVGRLNDQMLDAILLADKEAKARGEAGVSMSEAAERAQPYIDRLQLIASEAGLSDDKVNGLISTMLATPQLISFLMTDDGTIDEKKQAMLSLAQQIEKTPDGQFEVTSDDLPVLAEALAALGIDITTLPEGVVRVKKDDGSFATVESSLNNVARTRIATIRAQYLAPVGGAYPGAMAGQFATGGGVFGPGTGTSDSIPAWLSNGEHVWTAKEVQKAGGHAAVESLRRAVLSGALRLADGGPVVRVPGVESSPKVSTMSTLGDSRVVQLLEQIVAELDRPNVSFTEINPIHTDPLSDAWERAKSDPAGVS